MVKIIFNDNSEYLSTEWVEGYRISAKIDANEISIKANKEGLISLAGILLEIASSPMKIDHIHLDEFNYSLLPGSTELIIEKDNEL